MDRFLVCAAYHICASRHHSGQWSKGYAKLSQLARMGYDPGPLASWENEKHSEERQAAAALLMKRRREIRLEW